MEREFFRALCRLLRRLGRRRRSGRQRYTDGTILAVYAWAVLNDRPVVWACDPAHWPPGLRRGPLPSQSAVSRRLRTPSVEALARRLEHLLLRRGRTPGLVYAVDGKPLPIAAHSTDRQAGYGRGVGGKAKGYKLHALIDLNGVVWAWRTAPMNVDERTMAKRLAREIPAPGYLLGDANYDSNELFARAAQRGVQAVIPRRYGPGRRLGHRAQHPARVRSRDLLEAGDAAFGRSLHQLRRGVERFFATLTCGARGLTCLPAWVRTMPRVRSWVRFKLLFNQLRADRLRQTPTVGA